MTWFLLYFKEDHKVLSAGWNGGFFLGGFSEYC